MRIMLVVSLVLNMLVLLPVCAGLMIGAAWVSESYGAVTAARGILLAIYLAILVASGILLVHREPRCVAVLLAVQILYKSLTPLTVGTLANPVVLSNLLIVVVHLTTLLLIWRAIGNPFRGGAGK
jgi:hypothetical protein